MPGETDPFNCTKGSTFASAAFFVCLLKFTGRCEEGFEQPVPWRGAAGNHHSRSPLW